MKKKLFFISLILLLVQIPLSSNIFNRPRNVKVLSTKYFDFIFPVGSEKIVSYLSEYADTFFEDSARYYELKGSFRLPVAITFDSDMLEVQYTPAPYNRITIYASPVVNSSQILKDPLLDAFHEKVNLAVLSCKRSPFWQKFSDISGMDSLQPATLLNIPYSFIEGSVNSSVYGKNGIAKDGFCLSLLSEAKQNGKFPGWIDAAGAKDNYPLSISKIAASAFSIYLQNRFGLNKYKEFFEKACHVHFIKFTAGIFNDVYGHPIREIWEDFKASIPLPENLQNGENIFREDTESLYSMLQTTEDSVIFYDSAHGQVDKLVFNKDFNYREKYFTATGISNLSLSDDKKILAVSYDSSKSNRNLYKNVVSLYNLERKSWMGQKYNLRNGAVFDYSIETKAVAGFYTDKNDIFLQIYPLDFNFCKNLLYSQKLPPSVQIKSLIPAGIGKVLCIYYSEGKCILQLADTFYRENKFFHLPVNADNFKKESPSIISFTWTKENSFESGKRGYIKLSKNGIPENYFLQNENFSGGIYDSVNLEGKIYYSSHKSSHEELKFVEERKISYTEKGKLLSTAEVKNENWENSSDKIEKGTLNNYRISKYNLFKYTIKGTILPFFPISKIDFTKTTLAPGLGLTYVTNTDPLENLTGSVSFCAGFIDMDEPTFTVKEGYTLAGIFNTSVFPFDIAAGGMWNFYESGKYDLMALLGFEWNSIIGMKHNKLSFGIKQMWNSSTTSFDYQNEKIVELAGWTNPFYAYNTFKTYLSTNFSNVRQYGISSFEKLGIETNASFIFIYDPQKESKNSTYYDESTQFTFSFEFGLNLPCLFPAYGLENWIICMPVKLNTKWYTENGTSSESYVEILLAGYEIQKGLPGLNLYFHRLGIKAGYDLNFTYNTLTTEDPDIRDPWGFINALQVSTLDDYFYLSFELGISPVIGKFSAHSRINAGLQFQMHVRENRGSLKAVLNLNI